MSAAEKWPEVERLFHAALAHDEPARALFLREACGDDDALRREVESLIAYAANDRALTLPAMQAVAVVQQRSRGVAPPPLSSGTLVGSYTIVELLGAGGMGEVYRAHDSSLRRDIALKMLTSPPAGDDHQRTRILREARAAAAFNHPHICTIHEVGDADGRAYIAMEVVEGPSLSTRVAQGPLSIAETLRCGVELADAVSHAHERGIVHRDLKSANVMLTHDGRVKVLDFGLAKHVGASEAEATVTRADASPSQSGGRFGTVPYMSPEQLRGLPADARSDVWAIGVILYEMVAGIRPFTAGTSFELASLILHDPPAPLPSAVPPSLRAVIDRCLQKEPRDRYERAADLLSALRSIEHDRAIAVVATSGARSRRGPWAAAVVALVAAIAGVIWFTNRSVGEQLLADGQPPIRSLAVLPLTNASGNPDEAHFVEGMHDALITDLARLGLPRVIAKTSADMFKAGNQSLTDIGKQLGVDGLVTASVMRIDGRVRLTARLVRTRTGAIVWANRYERSAADILSLQNELVGAIAREIHATLSPEQTERLSTSRRVNPAAHDAYLKGRSMHAAFANLPDRQRLDAAVAQYEHSIRLDPTYAPPYAALSVLYQNGAQASLMPPTDTLARARAAALKSVELDDRLPEGHGALAGVFLWFEWNWAAANREIQRALELNPHSPDVLTSAVTYAALVSASVDEATRVSQHILDVDPLNPFSRVQTVWSAFFTRRYDDAISRAKALLDVWPDNIMGPWFLSSTYAVQRNAIGVGASCRQVLTLLRGAYVMQPLAMCAWAFGTVGLTDEARRLLSIVENPPPGLWLDPAVMGNAYGPLDKDRAFEWYERGFAGRSPNMIYMRVGAPWDATRDDSRFESLLRRMNFPK